MHQEISEVDVFKMSLLYSERLKALSEAEPVLVLQHRQVRCSMTDCHDALAGACTVYNSQ
jgi:hypothetical protein